MSVEGTVVRRNKVNKANGTIIMQDAGICN
jgi:hypothetical protein